MMEIQPCSPSPCQHIHTLTHTTHRRIIPEHLLLCIRVWKLLPLSFPGSTFCNLIHQPCPMVIHQPCPMVRGESTHEIVANLDTVPLYGVCVCVCVCLGWGAFAQLCENQYTQETARRTWVCFSFHARDKLGSDWPLTKIFVSLKSSLVGAE